MAETTEIRPQRGKQEKFLSTMADLAIYGGSAGGGKTWALLLEPLRHIHNPDFGAVIFRRTYPMIMTEGGMWDESQKIYPHLGASPRQTTMWWDFPSGARVRFAHMQHDKNRLDWQGSQIALIEFDELTHFTKQQFFYMLSRNRSMCGVRPYIRAGTNPDADSWVAQFIAWWIGDDGFAIPERAGVLRWMVRIGDKLEWFDSPGESRAEYPDIPPKSVTFVPAKVSDNPALLAADPGYLANLMALPLVDRERLFGGNWKIRPAAGKVFNRGWFPIVDAAPHAGIDCRGWDFAATAKKQEGDDPDFTAGVLMRMYGGKWYVLDSTAVRQTDTDGLMRNLAQQDRNRASNEGTEQRIRWEIEPGASGIRESRRMASMLAGYDARGVRPTGDKIQRAKGLAAQAEAGNVMLLRGGWNEEWLSHMHNIPDGDHDDIMDASVGAFKGTLKVAKKAGSVKYA